MLGCHDDQRPRGSRPVARPDDRFRQLTARRRLIADFDWERTIPDIALAYRFDIVLRGRDETPMATKRT